MAISKVTPRKLNKDSDYKLLKETEAVDMLNVRINHDSSGDEGVIKAAFGNTAVTQTLRAGDNVCVGRLTVEQENALYFLVWNSNGNHGIFRYNIQTDEAKEIMSVSLFGFQRTDYVQMDAAIDGNGDTQLFFTTGRGEPFMINASRAVRGGYDFGGMSDELILEHITLAKKPPLNPPTFTFRTDSNYDKNNLIDKVFQFTYQYVYEDGQVSALSPFSKLAYSTSSVLFDQISDPNRFGKNRVDISCRYSKADVKYIRIYARQGNDGTFYQIAELDNNKSLLATARATYRFYNDKIYTALSKNEENKFFDAVPQDVKTLAVSNNRLWLANYAEDRDNIETDIEVNTIQDTVGTIYNFTARNLRTSAATLSSNTKGDAFYTTSTSTQRLGVQIDLSTIPDVVKAGSQISVSFSVNYDRIQIAAQTGVSTLFDIDLKDDNGVTQTFDCRPNSSDGFESYLRIYTSPLQVTEVIDIDSDTSKADVAALIASELNKNYTVLLSPDLKTIGYSTRFYRDGLSTPSDDWRFWFGGSVSFVFEEAVDSLQDTNGDYLALNIRIAGSNIYPVKAVNYQDNAGRTFTDADSVPNSVFTSFTTAFKNMVVGFSSNSVYNGSALEVFKGNAKHRFAIHYKDDRGRRSFVQEGVDVFIPPSINNGESATATRVQLTLNHTPPSWASRYSILYGGNNTYEEYQQYTVAEAFAEDTSSYKFKTIYLSMRTLEGKPNSFKDARNARVDYEYAEGDRLRILRYKANNGDDEYGYTEVNNVEFDIIDYKFIDGSYIDLKSPDITEIDYRKSGWFLVLREREHDGWDSDDIIAGTDNWKYDTVVEIYRPKKETEEVIYYEIGEERDVVDDGSSIYHESEFRDKTNNGDTLSLVVQEIQIPIFGTTASFWWYQTDAPVYVGETLSFTMDGVPYTLTIATVVRYGDWYTITFTSPPDESALAGSYIATLGNARTIVELSGVGCFIRPRQMMISGVSDFERTDTAYVKTTRYETQLVEAMTLNDFFPSQAYSIGRPNVVNKEAKRTQRISSITWSDAYTIDSERLSLTSFNNSLANWVIYDNKYGGIKYLGVNGDSFTLFFERKLGVVPIGRNLVSYQDGDANATISTDVISDKPNWYSGEFGVNNNPESIAKDNMGRYYYADTRMRKIVKVGGNGQQDISDEDVSSYIGDLLGNFDKRVNTSRILGQFDGENDEYILSIQDTRSSTFEVFNAYPPVGDANYSYTFPVDSNDNMFFSYTEKPSEIPNWEQELRNWEDLCENWDIWWSGVLWADEVEENPTIFFDTLTALPATATVIITTRNFDFFVKATYTFSTGVLETEGLPSCSYAYGRLVSATSDANGDTIAYSVGGGYWTTRYSFKPDMMAFASDTLFSFEEGQLYKHVASATPANYAGTQYTVDIDVAFNYDPAKVKFFKALSVDGNSAAVTYCSTEDQYTNIPLTMWDERERQWYTFIPRDESNTSWSNYLFLSRFSATGQVWILEFGKWNDEGIWIDTEYWKDTPVAGSSSASAMTFTSRVDMFPIVKGSPLYYVPSATVDTAQASPDTNQTATILAATASAGIVIDRNRITYSGTSPFSAGDMIFLKKQGVVDGDPLRSTWMKADFTFVASSSLEIHALNAIYQTSQVHNQLGEGGDG